METISDKFERYEIPFERLIELCVETKRISDEEDLYCCTIPSYTSQQETISQLNCKDDVYLELSRVFLNVSNLKFLYEIVRSASFGHSVIKQLQDTCDRKDSNNEQQGLQPSEETPQAGHLLVKLRTFLEHAQKQHFPEIDSNVKEDDLVRSLNIIHNKAVNRKLEIKKEGF